LCYNAYIDKTYICIYIIVMDADLNLKGITCLNEKNVFISHPNPSRQAHTYARYQLSAKKLHYIHTLIIIKKKKK
jgi:hypothetical protein